MRVPHFWRLVAVVLAVAVTSCDSLPTEPKSAVDVDYAYTPTVIDGFTVARERLGRPRPAELTVSELIGAGGGTITILGHTLRVPAGVVSNPTLFTMIVQPTGLIEVDLTALEIPLIGPPTPVTQFDRPVQLTLNYARSPALHKRMIRDGGVIIHVEGDQATPVRTRVRHGQRRAVANLWHFSKYMMASN